VDEQIQGYSHLLDEETREFHRSTTFGMCLYYAGAMWPIGIGSKAGVGIEAAGDGAVDDGLLLLLQQLDQLLFGADVEPNPSIHVVKEADDDGLFGEGWEAPVNHFEMLGPQAPLIRGNTVRPSFCLLREPWVRRR
jgi:hypothetical protein